MPQQLGQPCDMSRLGGGRWATFQDPLSTVHLRSVQRRSWRQPGFQSGPLVPRAGSHLGVENPIDAREQTGDEMRSVADAA